ncbi:hypothetical protein PLUA15_190111 [Pseudomonas lundensis]|uniref:Uncharacterized protein n=1 Tax=Pseudomonas lundensis TaxID=86185 RepID=A0AAX2H587_9PSED|nr:hypothetical protein PLUA15_190111 [Pseudomonas lundensis]
MLNNQTAHTGGFFSVKIKPYQGLYSDESTLRSRRVSATRVRAFFLDGANFFMDFKEGSFAF